MDVDKGIGIKRFGKYFCSEDHAQDFVKMKKERENEEGRGGSGGGVGCC